MTRQINLYDAALLRRREWLSATNVAAATLALLLAMTGWSFSARAHLATLEAEQQAMEPQLKTLREQMTALARQAAALRPDAGLEAELASARGVLSLRGDILEPLQKGIGGDAGFGEYLRALARQSVDGLWLTGFAVGEGGSGMEIRGRMTAPALLPQYIRKLNGEPVFQGRAFAALKVSTPPAAAEGAAGASAAGEKTSPAASPRSAKPDYHEFVLAPESIPVRAAEERR